MSEEDTPERADGQIPPDSDVSHVAKGSEDASSLFAVLGTLLIGVALGSTSLLFTDFPRVAWSLLVLWGVALAIVGIKAALKPRARAQAKYAASALIGMISALLPIVARPLLPDDMLLLSVTIGIVILLGGLLLILAVRNVR